MAAATGYAGPTEEQLRAVAGAPAYGRKLVEVFAVRGGGGRPPPYGTITVFDGTRGQIVYNHSPDNPSPTQDGILLTGPHVAISAYGSIAIELDLHDGSEPLSEGEENIGRIHWDVYDTDAKYDKPVSETVNTRYGPVEVIYAVLSNAVEGEVAVKLIDRDGEDPARIFGKIIAHSKLFDIATVLFDNESNDNAYVRLKEPIPLARSILAVPLIWPLIIEVDLHDSSGDEILKGAMEFYPELSGKHVKNLVSKNGEIEVEIKWSDYR